MLFCFALICIGPLAANSPLPAVTTVEVPGGWEEIADIDEKISVLKFIFFSCEGNYEKIRTWRASYNLKNVTRMQDQRGVDDDREEMPPSEVPLVQINGKVLFYIDFQGDRLNWEYSCNGIEVLEPKGEEFQMRAGSLSSQRIFSSGQDLTMLSEPVSHVQHKEIPGYELVNQRIAHAKSNERYTSSPYTFVSDPRYFFCKMYGEEWYTHWSSFEKIATGIEGQRGDSIKQRFLREYRVFSIKEQDNQWYKIEEWRDNYGRISESIFSEKAGFNIIKKAFFREDGGMDSFTVWDYIFEKGVWIPWLYTGSYGENLFEYILIDSGLNETIPSNIFTHNGLSCYDGDILLDDTRQESMIFRKGNFVPLSKYGQPPDVSTYLSRTAASWLRLITMGLAIVLIIIGLYMRYLRMEKNRLQA